jgi:LuxR family transcriptional regulator, maltose regulon positive regulatory protein
MVRRSRLIERLDAGLHGKLTLVSAPAGFGKTTLVSDWVARCGRPTAWLSLDHGDNDPMRFLTYLVAALQTIAPAFGTGAMAALQSPQPPPPVSVLTVLLNDIAATPDACIVVLDDYHRIDASTVDAALAFLLEHCPPQMHLVITTREDPQLPLARLRARGDLNELRAADLRFTTAEAAAFLAEVMGLRLGSDNIAALEERTEGWIAGLQLAALSLQGHRDASGFIRAFAGDHRYIVDYLVEEVLARQPEGVRAFLLQTSILDRLHGPLCDAVTGQQDGTARLEALERRNLFVVPLDDRRHWYRYHHLFAEVLHARLRAEQPDIVAMLHRRASAWYEQHGAMADAIHHALAGDDATRAAVLVELAWVDIRRSRQEATMRGWLKAIPREVIRRRPVLSVSYAHVLLAGSEVEGVETLLADAERWLLASADSSVRPPGDATATAEMIVIDHEALRRLPGQIAVARAGLALALGDVAATVTYARRVLQLVPEDDHLNRGGGAGFLGLVAWANGDLEEAHRMFGDGMAHIEKAGNIADTLNGAVILAHIRIAQGRLHQAMRTYEQALQRATEPHGTGSQPVLRGTADIYVGMSELHREWNDLDAATQLLLQSKELGEHTGFPQHPYRWRVAMARLREAQGDFAATLALLDEAERVYVPDFAPDVRPVAAMKARLWIAQGRLGEALAWARTRALTAHDELSYGREFEHVTLARLLLARSANERADTAWREAVGLLQRLLGAAEQGERTGSIINILVVQALAHQMRGDIAAALVLLARVLRLAEPEGYVRLFADEGTPMAHLLHAAAMEGIASEYVRRLLRAFGGVEERPSAPPTLDETLSERERDVLRLLGTDAGGPEIARALVISLSTLRTHTRNIYGKLGVHHRRAAVQRAAELDLL